VYHKHNINFGIALSKYAQQKSKFFLDSVCVSHMTNVIEQKNVSRDQLVSPTKIRGLLYVTILNLYISNYGYLCGTVTYVDYYKFSHLNPITNPTPLPNATLTIGATAHNPNYRGSCEYPIYRGSRTQPLLSGLPHATLMVRAAGRGLVGAGGELGLRPRGLRCALAVRAHGSRVVTAFILHCKKYMNLYMTTAKNL
jgi:hypothetical protein